MKWLCNIIKDVSHVVVSIIGDNMFKGYVGIAVRPSIAELNREHIKLKLKASKLEKERDKARSAFDKLLKEFLKLQNENETLIQNNTTLSSHPLRLDNNDYELVIELLKLELEERKKNDKRILFLSDWCGSMRVEYIAQLIRDEQDPDRFIEEIDKEIEILNKDKND